MLNNKQQQEASEKLEQLCRKNSISSSVGWGCTNALQISALALTGSCTLLGMSALIPNNHMPQSIEDAARRLADTSVVVGTLSALGLIAAGASAEEERLLDLLIEKNALINSQDIQIRELRLKEEMYSFVVPRYQYRSAVEARDKEILRRGETVRQLRQELRAKDQQLKKWENLVVFPCYQNDCEKSEDVL